MRRFALLVLLALTMARPAGADDAGVCADAAENGQRVRDKGHFVESRDLFAKCAKKECPKLVRDDCLTFLEQLRKRMPSIVVRVTDGAHHDVTHFRVSKDNKVLVDEPSGTAIDVDPGATTLHVEAEGFTPRDVPLVVAEGEQRRLVEIVVLPPQSHVQPLREPPPPPPVSNGPGAATWITGGVGVAGLAVFGIFQAVAQPEYSDLKKQPCAASGTCNVGSLRAEFDASAIGLGVGAAGLATAVILYLAVDRHPKPPPQSASFVAGGIRF